MSDCAERALAELAALWVRERESTRERVRAERQRWTLTERVERGVSLRDLVVDESDAAVGGRVVLWLRPNVATRFEDVRIAPGEPVRLWSKDPEGEDVEPGVVTRIERTRIGVAVSAEHRPFLDHGAFALDREAPEVSFDRAARAIANLRAGKPG
ncbi:MAG TPA: hypothetical protein VGI70_20840, partial [Polyangiales bacterium]